ncbi:MAG: hypothetical protein K1X66_03105 [Verrucomicrobiae bacterium]|nr:hypothetical protein [Verrucomicrobiae bacterium]
MNKQEFKSYRKKSPSELLPFVSGDKPASEKHIAAKLELERKANRPAFWMSVIAIIISILSLLVSIYK